MASLSLGHENHLRVSPRKVQSEDAFGRVAIAREMLRISPPVPNQFCHVCARRSWICAVRTGLEAFEKKPPGFTVVIAANINLPRYCGGLGSFCLTRHDPSPFPPGRSATAVGGEDSRGQSPAAWFSVENTRQCLYYIDTGTFTKFRRVNRKTRPFLFWGWWPEAQELHAGLRFHLPLIEPDGRISRDQPPVDARARPRFHGFVHEWRRFGYSRTVPRQRKNTYLR